MTCYFAQINFTLKITKITFRVCYFGYANGFFSLPQFARGLTLERYNKKAYPIG